MLITNLYKIDGGKRFMILKEASLDDSIECIKDDILNNPDLYNRHKKYFNDELDYDFGGSVNVLDREYLISELVETFDRAYHKQKFLESLEEDLVMFKCGCFLDDPPKEKLEYPWNDYVVEAVGDENGLFKDNKVYEQMEFDFMKKG